MQLLDLDLTLDSVLCLAVQIRPYAALRFKYVIGYRGFFPKHHRWNLQNWSNLCAVLIGRKLHCNFSHL